MAKSLRSKWKRKMRAVKRERYGEKELKMLNERLTKAGDYQLAAEIKNECDDAQPAVTGDNACALVVEMSPAVQLSRPRRIKFRKPKVVHSSLRKDGPEDEPMVIDKIERVFSKRTMRDQFGNYPSWMNKRKMLVQQKKNKRIGKRKADSISKKKK